MSRQNAKVKSQNPKLKIKSDIKVRSYRFALMLIDYLNTLPKQKMYWIITDQLFRSGTSVGANVVEAKSASSRKDFAKYYDIALKSANGTKFWLCILRDGRFLSVNNEELRSKLMNEIIEISKIIAASLLTVRNKRN